MFSNGEVLIFVRSEICSVEMFVWLYPADSNCNVFSYTLVDLARWN